MSPGKIKFIILTITLLILSSSNAIASERSLTYSMAANIISITEDFSLKLFYSISNAYFSLYVKIATIGMILILTKYLLTRVAPIVDMINFIISLIIASSIAFNAQLFHVVVYDTFFDLLYGLNSLVIRSASESLSGSQIGGPTSLMYMFNTVDQSIGSVMDFALKVIDKQTLWSTSSIPVMIEAFLIYLLYLFVGFYFVVIITLAIFSIHMFIIFMPITISLYPFKRLRGYLFSSINAVIYYALVTVIACVAISISVYLIQNISIAAEDYMQRDKYDLPADFLCLSILLGFFSIFLIKSSTEIAARFVNAASSQLGGTFSTVASTVTRTTIGTAKVAAPIAGNALAAVGNKAASNRLKNWNL